MTAQMPPGWYDDPDGSPNAERRWDGHNWTPERRRKATHTPPPAYAQPPQAQASYAQPRTRHRPRMHSRHKLSRGIRNLPRRRRIRSRSIRSRGRLRRRIRNLPYHPRGRCNLRLVRTPRPRSPSRNP